MRSLTAALHAKLNPDTEPLGQMKRILLQLAKAVLLRPKVLLIASDFFTKRDDIDGFSLEVLSKNLFDSVILAAVEQLESLSFYSHVIVMDRGEILEVGKPQTLIQDERSYLHKQLESKQKRDTTLTERVKNTMEFKIAARD